MFNHKKIYQLERERLTHEKIAYEQYLEDLNQEYKATQTRLKVINLSLTRYEKDKTK